MGPLRPAVRVVSALAVEMGWMAAHLATYPLGLLRDAGDDVDPRVFGTDRMSLAQRSLLAADVAAAATPIVLIHGMVDNRTIFAMLRRGLRRRGFSCIRTFSYGPHTSDVRAAATSLGSFVEALCEQTGADKVHIVGHSLGGLIARYYVQVGGGSDRVESVVTLGTPHQGTVAAWLVPHHMVRQLLPDSDIIAELAAPAPACSTRFVAFYSDVDQMVIPADHGRLEHPDLTRRERAGPWSRPSVAPDQRPDRPSHRYDVGRPCRSAGDRHQAPDGATGRAQGRFARFSSGGRIG